MKILYCVAFIAISLFAQGLLDHFVKLSFALGFEIGFDLVDFSELGKDPVAELSEIVHPGDPLGFHGRLLFLVIFPPITFDLNN